MNIFYVSESPSIAAEMLCDKHVVKMTLETAQLLCTAHRILDGQLETAQVYTYKKGASTGKVKTMKYYMLRPFELNNILYKATHINHPSSVWVRQSCHHYDWALDHFSSLLNEYHYRYGKIHKCSTLLPHLRNHPSRIPKTPFVQPPCAMDDQYIISGDSVTNYRNYYNKGKNHLHNWTKREPPHWIVLEDK